MRLITKCILIILPLFSTPIYSQELADTTSIRNLSAFLAASNFWSTNPDSQYYYSNKGLIVARKLNDALGEADMLKALGIYYWSKDDMLEAMKHYRRAKEIYDSLGSMLNVVKMNTNIGMVYYRLGDYKKSVNCHYESIRYLESLGTGNQSNLAGSYNSLGLVFRDINDYQSSLSSLNKSLSLYTEINDSLNIAGTFVNFGTVYKKWNKIDSAHQYFLKALRIFERLHNPKGLAISYNHLALILKDLGNFSEAFLYAQIAYGISIEKGFRENQVTYLISMGDILLEEKKFNDALGFYNKAKVLSESYQNNRKQAQVYKGITDCKIGLNEYKEAIRYYDLYLTIKDSLYSSDNARSISNLKISYEVEKKDIEIMLLTRDNEIEKLNRKNLLLASISVLTLLVISLAVLIYKRKNDKKLTEQAMRLLSTEQAIINNQLQNRILREEELKQELDFQNRALTTYTLSLVQKNAQLEDIKILAQEAISKSEGKNLILSKIVKSIENSYTVDNDWEGFRTYFEQVHPDFLKKLKHKFPELTTSELRLCALIRLSLSIKESAQLLSISPDSVKVARHRIRKKLNMELDDNLTELIMSI